MQYQMNKFLFAMILTELEDAVGKENCSTRAIDKVAHSVDYYWLSRMWADRGERMPEADIVVCPENAQEVSKVLKIANYYKIPVTTWGAGGGSQGGAQQIASRIGCDEIDLLLFFRNPLDRKPNEPDENALLRLCDVHNIPVATNIATAEVLIHGLERGDLDWREIVKNS